MSVLNVIAKRPDPCQVWHHLLFRSHTTEQEADFFFESLKHKEGRQPNPEREWIERTGHCEELTSYTVGR